MKVHPILFSTDMVRAILAGIKTQTRRKLKGKPLDWLVSNIFITPQYIAQPDNDMCPYGKIGDALWVREAWAKVSTFPEPDCFGKYLYKSMGDTPSKWEPSIFMPKEACRIFLKIKNIKVERLQDISEEDAKKEGIESEVIKSPCACDECGYDFIAYRNYMEQNNKDWEHTPACDCCDSAVKSFSSLWQKINGKDSWNDNPFVWVIEYEKCDKPINL